MLGQNMKMFSSSSLTDVSLMTAFPEPLAAIRGSCSGVGVRVVLDEDDLLTRGVEEEDFLLDFELDLELDFVLDIFKVW